MHLNFKPEIEVFKAFESEFRILKLSEDLHLTDAIETRIKEFMDGAYIDDSEYVILKLLDDGSPVILYISENKYSSIYILYSYVVITYSLEDYSILIDTVDTDGVIQIYFGVEDSLVCMDLEHGFLQVNFSPEYGRIHIRQDIETEQDESLETLNDIVNLDSYFHEFKSEFRLSEDYTSYIFPNIYSNVEVLNLCFNFLKTEEILDLDKINFILEDLNDEFGLKIKEYLCYTDLESFKFAE